MENAFRIAKNSVILMIAEIINKAIALGLVIVLARYLGQMRFGQYTFVVTMMVLFQVFADFGLDGLTVREIAKDHARTSHYLSNVLLLKIILSAATFFLLWLTTLLLHKPAEILIATLLIGAAIFFSSIANTFFAVFNAHEKLSYKALITVGGKTATLVLSLILVVAKAPLLPFIVVILLGEAVKAVWCVFCCFNEYRMLWRELNLATCFQLLKTGFPFALIGVISLVYFRIDIVMLSVMTTDEMVGFYSAAYGLMAAFLFITEAYMLSVFPALSRSAEKPDDMLFFIWTRSFKYLLVLSLFITLFVGFSAKPLVLAIFSRAYAPSIQALQVLIWTLPWIFVNAINMRVLYAADKQKQATFVAFASMTINICLNAIFIPRFGFIGAAYATIIAEIINVLMYFYLIGNLLRLRLPPAILTRPCFGACAVAALCLLATKTGMTAAVLGALMVSFPAAMFACDVFDREDMRIFKKIAPVLVLRRK